MTPGKRRPILRIALAIAGLLAAVAALSSYLVIQQFSGLCDVDDWDRAAFDSAAWKASQFDSRFRYVRDILDKEMFVGAATSALYDALGKPDYVSSEENYATYLVRDFPDGGCAFNAVAILHFDFDDDGRITGQKVRFD